jgi:tetratricopeptide (TPR) repeat protein
MGKRYLFCVLLASAAAVLPATAGAQAVSGSDLTQAKEHFDRGLILYSVGDYKAALEKFLLAFELHPHHKIKYNLGLCYIKLGERAKAAQALEAFVVGEGEAIDPGIAKEIAIILEEATAKIAVFYFDVEAKWSEVFVDGESRGRTPLPGGVYVEPGEHSLKVVATDGMEWEAEVDVKAGETMEIQIGLADMGFPGLDDDGGAARESLPVPEKQKKKIHPAYFYASLGLALALAAAGAVTGGLSVSRASDLDDLDAACEELRCDRDEDLYAQYEADKDEAYDKASTMADATTGLLAAAGGLALTAAVLAVFTFGKKEKKEKTPGKGAALVPSLCPAGVFMKVEF